MKLSLLFDKYQGNDIEIKEIKTNSKAVKNGDLFVCTMGAKVDRHDYIEDAINNGAACIVVSKDVNYPIPTIKVDNTNQELIRLLKVYYDNPQDKLKIIGITGTDGKTTTAKIIQELLGNNICGYIGTLGADCLNYAIKTGNTTPSEELLFNILNEFVNRGMKYVAMEASSEGFFYHRMDGIKFDVGCLTNITSEHLNTHKTLENYIDCKKQLFINSNKQILNSSDLHFNEVKEVSKDYITYGFQDSDTLKVVSYNLYPDSTIIDFVYKSNKFKVKSSLIGKFNVDNLALAILVLLNEGIDIDEIKDRTMNLIIPGRMQAMNYGQDFYCIVDYAHTANAVKNVLEFANTLEVNRIITVIGQAGGRDPYKRKEVGKTTLDLSDYAILTADDPRFEKVEDIIQMMLEDTEKTNYEIIVDRHLAIEKAIMMANKNDLVLALGKGVDPYQKVEDRDEYYLETEEVERAIKKRIA